jgi:hypothetical protein
LLNLFITREFNPVVKQDPTVLIIITVC